MAGDQRQAWDDRGDHLGQKGRGSLLGRDVPWAVKPEWSPYLSNLMVISGGYADNSGGSYSGQPNAIMGNPVDWVRYLIDDNVYGGASVKTTGFGDFDDAREALRYWSGWGAGQSGKRDWASIHQVTSRQTVLQTAAQIVQSLAEIRVVQNSTRIFGAFVWTPGGTSIWPSSQLYNSGVALKPSNLVSIGNETLDLRVWTGDVEADILNDLTIRYDYDWGKGDYRRTATCNSGGSDDGYGSEWPDWLVNGTRATAQGIAEWSELKYGKRSAPNGIDLPYITDHTHAVAIGLYLLWRYYRLPVFIQFQATPELSDLAPGHIFVLDHELQTTFGLAPTFWGSNIFGSFEHALWSSIYWLCTYADVQGNPGSNRMRTIRGQWYPQTIGNETAGGFTGGPIGDIGESITGPTGPIGVL